jgi:hypothetical protein
MRNRERIAADREHDELVDPRVMRVGGAVHRAYDDRVAGHRRLEQRPPVGLGPDLDRKAAPASAAIARAESRGYDERAGEGQPDAALTKLRPLSLRAALAEARFLKEALAVGTPTRI